MPKTKVTKKNSSPSFADKLNQELAGTPTKLEDSKALFFTKGFLMIVFALLLFFGQTQMLGYLPFIFAGFMIIDGLIMIVNGLMSADSNKSLQTFSLVLGGLAIIVGVLPIIFPAMLIPYFAFIMVLGVSLDALFTMVTMLLLIGNRTGGWWAIVAGMIAVIFLIGFVTNGTIGDAHLWLELYIIAQGVFYCLTPFLFASAGRKKN